MMIGQLARREGVSGLALIGIAIAVIGYMIFPGMYHRAAQVAVNTVFDALHAGFGGEKQRPIGGADLDKPPRPPGTKTTTIKRG